MFRDIKQEYYQEVARSGKSSPLQMVTYFIHMTDIYQHMTDDEEK